MASKVSYEQLPLFPEERKGRLVTVRRRLDADAIQRYPKLTQRLLDVAELLAAERTNRQIAEQLRTKEGKRLSVATVRGYVEDLLQITDADSRAGVVMALTTPPPDAPIPFERRTGTDDE